MRPTVPTRISSPAAPSDARTSAERAAPVNAARSIGLYKVSTLLARLRLVKIVAVASEMHKTRSDSAVQIQVSTSNTAAGWSRLLPR